MTIPKIMKLNYRLYKWQWIIFTSHLRLDWRAKFCCNAKSDQIQGNGCAAFRAPRATAASAH
jgi:hypothetical protein